MTNMFRCISTVAVLVFAGCAHQVPPSGGPDDKTPPAVRSMSPPIGSVNVPATSAIEFVFSEWINTRNVEKFVSVFPPPPDGIKINASGRKIRVRPRRAFADSTTYHIVLSTALTDLHSNSLGNSFQYFFSTGPAIDSGKVTGCVIQTDKKILQPKIALYSRDKGNISDTVLFGQPSYLGQTDSAGNFSLENIHRGAYEIIAFSDENSNNRLDPGLETVFAPVERSFTLDSSVGPLELYRVICDTTTRHLALFAPLSSTICMGEWTGGTTLAGSPFDSTWRVEHAETRSKLAIKEYVPLGRSQRFLLRLADTMRLSPYLLVCTKRSPLSAAGASGRPDTIRFNGVVAADTVAPVVKGREPQGSAPIRPLVKLAWSKPVIAARRQWYCVDSLKDTVKVTLSAGFCDTTVFTCSKNLRPSMTYAITVPDSLFHDCCGNMPKDSAGVVIKFSTLSEEDLCFSLSGGASCLRAEPARKWLFLPLGKPDMYMSRDSAAAFRFDSIPAAKGHIAFFIDSNGDGVPDAGSLVPRIAPEPYRVLPDTVEARARWDVEGIDVREACRSCASGAAQKKATPK